MWLLLLLLLILLLFGLFALYRRRYHIQDAKTAALLDVAGMSNFGEIIPEEGDVVEWGHNANAQQFSFAGDEMSELSTQLNAEDGVQSKRRKSDLFVI